VQLSGGVIAAVLKVSRGASRETQIKKISDDDGMLLTARLATSRILERQQEQNFSVTIAARGAPHSGREIGERDLEIAAD
jgi:hypothetical protein